MAQLNTLDNWEGTEQVVKKEEKKEGKKEGRKERRKGWKGLTDRRIGWIYGWMERLIDIQADKK